MLAGLEKIPVLSKAQYRAYEFKERILPRVRSGGFEVRFLRDGFPGEFDENTERQIVAYEAVIGWLKNEGSIVAMCGPRGVGKTTIAAQISAKRAWEDLQSCFDKADGKREDTMCRYTLYWKMTGLVKRLKPLYADFGSIETAALEDWQRGIVSCELLVIDELQEAGDDSRHKERILTDVIDRRYAAQRDTILITNQTPEEFRTTTSGSILSRLGEHGTIIDCAWGSFREQPRL